MAVNLVHTASNNRAKFGAIQVNAPIIGNFLRRGTSAPEAERTRVRNELLAKIGPPNAEPRPAQGTCEWILKDEKFQSWRESSTQPLLWVSGRPGKGKSHLAAFLGEHLSHRTAEALHSPNVLKFSCDNTNVRRSTSLAVHLNILHQILQFCRSDEILHEKTVSILNDVHTSLNSNIPREDLWVIIKEFINTTDHLTYFILDGLDECDADSIDDLSKKVQLLCSIACREGRPYFKAILLSRPLAIISNKDLRIDLDDDEQYGAQILHEIRLFIGDKMGSSPFFETRKDELEILKATLVERSNKTFLWVSLALEILKSHPSDLTAIVKGQGQDALDRLLPIGLPSIYSRMLLEALQGKYNRQRNSNQKACAKVIQFVCVAFRPLTLTELQGAVDLSLEASAIISYCKHLLVQSSDETVYEHKEEQFGDADDELGCEPDDTDNQPGDTIEPDYEPKEKTFQLVHLSLKEYLQQRRRFKFPTPLGLLLWPYLSSTVDALRTATHSFYYLDHILFVGIFRSLNGVFKGYPVAGFILVSLFARCLWNQWMRKRSWMLQMVLKVFERLLEHCVFGVFAASERTCHRDLFLRSLAILMDEKSGLQKETVENLEAKGALSAKKPKSVDASLAPFGRYACQFWVDHLYCLNEVDWTSRKEVSHGDLVLQFLDSHFLDWLRSLALQNNIRDGVLSVKKLIRIFNNLQDGDRKLELFLKDGERFMMLFAPFIERAPFQVYGSALAFCPNNSIVRSTFRDRVLPFAKRIKSPHNDWSPVLQVLEGPDFEVTSVAFSNDGKLIASASWSDKIYLWDTETGRLKSVLRIENGRLCHIAFSSRGNLVASGLQDLQNPYTNIIWVWDEKTGKLVRSIDVDSEFVAITCSPDGNVLAAATVTSIQLWHLGTETVLRDIPNRETRSIHSMAFSPDGYLIASMSDQISIWGLETGQLEFTIVRDDFSINEHWHPGQGARLDSIPFSVNSSAGSSHSALQLWDPETGKPSKALLKHFGTKKNVAFSPDGSMIASGHGSSIYLRDSATCSLLSENPPGHSVQSMIISSDKKILAAFSEDDTINIWSVKAGVLIPRGARIPNVSAFAFSPRCDILAFALYDEVNPTVRLWGVTEGKETHVLDQLGGEATP
ncbi:hypothetical protein FPRO05_13730 [Fusarium proliferatum]|uniref:Nephrocystin 3-like N-terminal domain-containing protein n=1 Tax=Gibberella intermedia TaxID=948311 RepID=A0A365MXM2_GIBIN|nr:hypothetical protein FPRO05_13730 [Fusarium proliferatum]